MSILTNKQAAWRCNALQLPSEKMLWNPSIQRQATLRLTPPESLGTRLAAVSLNQA